MECVKVRSQKLYLGISLCLVFVAGLTGCSRGPAMTTVEGVVTLDGKPIEKGAIIFEPANGAGRSAGATIENGNYTAEMPPGEKRVRITGFEVTGQVPAYKGRPDSPMRDVVKEIVPPKFNARSELTQSIDSSDTTANFDLKTS